MIEAMSERRAPQDDAAYRARLIRSVSPPLHVAIDLPAMYGRAPHFVPPPTVSTIAPLAVVVGYLHSWVLCDAGWLGACSYRIHLTGTHFIDQNHLVPGRVLTPATAAQIDAARQTGQLRF
jgi:hypothetical protein